MSTRVLIGAVGLSWVGVDIKAESQEHAPIKKRTAPRPEVKRLHERIGAGEADACEARTLLTQPETPPPTG